MSRASLATLMVFGCFISSAGLADHPGEGSITLEDLSREAIANNLEIQEASARVSTAGYGRKATLGGFLPELSLEGGPLRTRLDNEKHSGTALYGKAEWNLFRGGMDKARASQAGLEEELAEQKLEWTKAKVLREVASAFYELQFLHESLALKEKAVALNAEQAKLARVKRASGYTSEADVIEFELREATLRSDIKQLEQEREERSRELAVLLGRKASPAVITVRGHLERAGKVPKEESVAKSIASKNPEAQEASFLLRNRQYEKTIAQAGFLPTLNLEAKYGRLANDEKVFQKENNYSLFLTFNLPLFSGLSTVNGYQAAVSSAAESESSLQRSQLSASAAASRLFSRLKSIRDRLDLEEKTLARSEEYYKITVGEYRRGVKNSPDMVGATERLFEARLRNLQYRRDFNLTRLEIEGLAGSTPGDSSLY